MRLGNIYPLYLVGDTNDDAQNQRLYQFDQSGYDDCLPDQHLNSIDATSSSFVRRNRWILHLHANIGKYEWQ